MTGKAVGGRFPRCARLRRRPDFLEVQSKGRRAGGAKYLVLALSNRQATQGVRIGITVSKKVGNAVARNRVKRWVRESCRRLLLIAPVGHDMVVLARPGADQVGYQATFDELSALWKRLEGAGRR